MSEVDQARARVEALEAALGRARIALAQAEVREREAERIRRRPPCGCGCGEQVKSDTAKYLPGHSRRGEMFPTGEGTTSWKGDEATSSALHAWLRRHYPPTGICEECEEDVGTHKPTGTHYAFRHHPKPHTRDRDDYRELCPSCHATFDAPLRRN